MKKSRYNVFLETSPNETLVFNGMSKKFFTFSSENIPLLKQILESPDTYYIKADYQGFLSTLKANGFLIDDNLDELDLLRSLFESYKDAKIYSLMILTTYACNFSCWYCVQKHRDVNLNPETIDKIKKHISKYLLENNIKTFQISWFGGEPLLNFDAIRNICLFAQDFCNRNGISYSCGITTNGSLVTPAMAVEMKNLGFKDFQITIDGIKENHNKTRYNTLIKDSFTRILNNIKILSEIIPDVEITLRFNYTNKNLNEAIVTQIDSALKDSKDKVELLFRKVWQEHDSTELSNRLGTILKMFQQKGYKILHDYDNLRLTSCYVEQTHYNSIFPDGTIDKCSNKDMGETRGYLSEDGDIVWEKLPDENEINVFNFPSECVDCLYLPLCMGPCPGNRKTLISEKMIRCHIEDKDERFSDDIRNFAIINRK